MLCLGAKTLDSSQFTYTVLPDWSDYERVHAGRRNLRVHLIAVPLFAIAFPAVFILLARAEFLSAIASLLVVVGSMAAQASGHSKEAIAPEPFNGLLDFLKRWFSEQYFRFPLFVFTGRWWRQYQAAGG